MPDSRKNDDLWAQLLGAARTEAAKQADLTKPDAAPAADDPWAQLMATVEAEADRRLGGKEPDPSATAPEGTEPDPSATVPEKTEPDPSATVPEKTEPDPSATVPEGAAPSPDGFPVSFEKGTLLLDTYRIESDPMKGGMGSVWRVHHTGWNTDLAMKRPHPELFVTEADKQKFIDECRHWINLGLHPNIVSCYYVREIGGVPTIFSEWMENGDLAHHIKNGTLYEGSGAEVRERLMDIAIQYARGLHYAHENGLIHQDVKPGNLLLTSDWQAKAADFGLANARAQLTVLEGAPTVRETDRTMNAAAGAYTPAYCSMEQMDRKVLTRRTDIYSWAVSVMEMYAGVRLWENGVVAGAGCRDYMAQCRVPVPEALQELLAKCMAISPEDRPHDFGVIGEELEQIWEDVTGTGYPRPAPSAASDTADSLNNRALSFLDIGRAGEAEALWEKALAADPYHENARFNRELYLLRSGRKFDYQVMEELARIPTEGQADMIAAIARECHGADEEIPENYFIGSDTRKEAIELQSAVRQGDRVLFSGRLNGGDQPRCIGRFAIENRGNDLEMTVFPAEKDKTKKLWLAVPCPEGNRALLVRGDCTLRLCDWKTQQELKATEPIPELKMFRYTGNYPYFSPDGGTVAVYVNADEYTFFLRTDVPEVTAQLKMRMIGFYPDGRALLRGKVARGREGLFIRETDGTVREVFRFGRALEKAREYCGPDGVFLSYEYRDRPDECFRLDGDFRAVPLRREMFDTLEYIQYYDAAHGFLCSGGSRKYYWDTGRQHCLCTFTPGGRYSVRGENAVTDIARGRLLLWDQGSYAVWQPLPLPALPYQARPAEWRLSRVTTAAERLEEESRLGILAKEFERYRLAGETGGMARVHRECLDIPGFSGSRAAVKMEDALEPLARKSALYTVHSGPAPGVDSEMYGMAETVRCSADTAASYNPHRPGCIRFFRMDGSPAYTADLPETAEWAAVRNGRILAFGKQLDAAAYDLRGRPLDPARPAPRSCEPPDLNNVLKYGFPRMIAADPAGRRILYALHTPFDPFRKKQDMGLYQLDLETGRTLRLTDRYREDCCADYLSDGSILLAPMPPDGPENKETCGLRRLDPEDGSLMHLYSLSTRPLDREDSCSFILNPERNYILTHCMKRTMGLYGERVLYTMDGRLVCFWENRVENPVFIPGGLLLSYGDADFHLMSLETGKNVYNEPLRGETLVSPDGREIRRGGKLLRPEYEYRAD